MAGIMCGELDALLKKYDARLFEYVGARREFVAGSLARLAAIPSVSGVPEKGAAFGAGTRRMLDETAALFDENGFSAAVDPEGRYLTATLGEGEDTVGLFSHGDVVPAGEGWTVTEPFKPTEKGGYLFGRGVNDNKSGVVFSLVAACAIRDLALPFRGRLTLFVGANEESGMNDIPAYLASNKPPRHSIVPDACFPAVRGEKGILRIRATSPPLGDDALTEFGFGTAINAVPAEASAVYSGEKITETGRAAHAALPEGGVHAGAKLLARLMEKAAPSARKTLRDALEMTDDFHDAGLGLALPTDEVFGRGTCVAGTGRLKEGRLEICFDIRYSSVPAGDVESAACGALFSRGWSAEIIRSSPGFLLPVGHPLIAATVGLYRHIFGGNPQATVNSGGTYARLLPDSVSIGTSIADEPWPVLPVGHGSVHAPDETVSINGVCRAAMFTAALASKVSFL